MSKDADSLSIGEVAESAGVSVSAVRYYEEIGVVSALARVGGKRRFSAGVVDRVAFVRRAQAVGFNLNEIRAVLSEDASDWREIVERKLVELVAEREQLDTAIQNLRAIRECDCVVASACLSEPGP